MKNEPLAPETSEKPTTPVSSPTSEDQIIANLTQSLSARQRSLGYDKQSPPSKVADLDESTVVDFAAPAPAKIGSSLMSVCQQMPQESNVANGHIGYGDDEDRQRRIMKTLIDSIGAGYQKCTLDNYEIYDDEQRRVVGQLRGIHLEDFVCSGGKLFFYGPSGTGKDHLANALMLTCAREHRMRCRSLNARKLCSDTFADAVATVKDVSRRKYDIVTVSDPAPRNDTHRDWLYEIIEERNKQRLATWVTINVLTREAGQELLSAAVFGRYLHNAESVACNWDDYRLRK